MRKAIIAGGALVIALVLLFGYRRLHREMNSVSAPPAEVTGEAHPSFLYGRIATVDGVTYEGRLRWGGVEEAFWGNYFNGAKKTNTWVAHVPPEQVPKERRTVAIFGVEIANKEEPVDLGRLFLTRFGDIRRIEMHGRDIRVTLKSGAVSELDRFSASDFDDGVRVWDSTRGMVDLDSLRIRSIELLPATRTGPAPDRLHGTVRTRHGDFTGFIQWHREESVGSDELNGRTVDGDRTVRFDTIRSIARRSPDSAAVTLVDGSELVLSGSSEVGEGNRGIYVDDARYGRVLVSWDAFDRVEFNPGGNGPAYDDFPPGGPLTGSVTTRVGRRLAGRLVYDLDESEITETLDAPSHGVNYTIPFGLIASIMLPGQGAKRAPVTLHSGEKLELERTGDLGEGNAGILIFVDGREDPEYVPWIDIAQIELNRPKAMYPPLTAR